MSPRRHGRHGGPAPLKRARTSLTRPRPMWPPSGPPWTPCAVPGRSSHPHGSLAASSASASRCEGHWAPRVSGRGACSCGRHPGSHCGRRLARRHGEEVVRIGPAERDHQVETVQQRRRQPATVPIARGHAAAARPFVDTLAARARIHGCHEQESRRERHRPSRPAHPDHTLLERLAQCLQGRDGELAELVEEQDPVSRHTRLARTERPASTADQRHDGCLMMRRAEGGPAEERAIGQRASRRRVDPRHRQRFLWAQGRQEAGQPLRQHGLARPWGPHHQQVMVPRGRHLERSSPERLPAHVGQVWHAGSVWPGSRAAGPRARCAARAAPWPGSPGLRHRGRRILEQDSPRPRRTAARRAPLAAVASAKAIIPGTCRNDPLSPSSPQKAIPSVQAGLSSPVATRSPTAIGRSRPAPPLRRPDGARLIVTLLSGQLIPLDKTAARTLSRDSRTAASGSPTMVKPGSPFEMWTSTETGVPTAPCSVAEAIEASTPLNGRPEVFVQPGIPGLRPEAGAMYPKDVADAWSPSEPDWHRSVEVGGRRSRQDDDSHGHDAESHSRDGPSGPG